MKYKLVTIILLLNSVSYSQNTFNGCPITGDNKLLKIREQDELKNRYEIPAYYDTIDIADLLKAKTGSLKIDSPIVIVGYILEVKQGGLESTNCHSKDFKDTHIYVVANLKEKLKRNSLVVEVTPRIRELKKVDGIDWTTKGLSTFTGQKVYISGYLFDDFEHKQNSKSDYPQNKKDWRSSTYEIHPVTDIQLF